MNEYVILEYFHMRAPQHLARYGYLGSRRKSLVVYHPFSMFVFKEYFYILLSNTLRHLFMPNVTAEIAEAVDCPILAASFGQEWIFDEP